MAGALILLGACNISDPLQRFTFQSDNTVSLANFSGQCVTFGGPLGKFPLYLSPCNASDSSQQWVYDGADTSIRNPNTTCAGTPPGWQCLSWSGIEYGSCTSDPPALGLGCGLSAWPTGGPTTWNNALEVDAPAVGMVQALHAHPTGPSPSGLCAVAVPPPPPPVPTPDVLAWSTKEVMCLYDIDICTYMGSQGCNCQDAPPPVDIWSPTALDTDSWLRAGVSAGCAIHILVSKHMCGFVSWNSTAGQEWGYNYSSLYASSPVDVVDAFVRSARAMQQPIGTYYSLTNNARTKTCAGNILPNPSPGQLPVTPLQYDDLVKAHLTELWTNYGELQEVWFDGGFTPSQKTWIPGLLASLQPHAVAFNGESLSPNPTRWIGSESGYAPNETWSTCDYEANGSGGGDPNSQTWFPAETDFTVLSGDTWFYDLIHSVRPPAQLRSMYEASVGHNTQALIGIGIPPNGTLVGTAQESALRTLGAYISGCYGSPIASTSGSGLSFFVMPSAPVAIDRVVMSENQTTGQRVRSWELTATLQDGSSLQLAQGSSVGNKRIVVLPEEVKGVTMVTMTIKQAVGTPTIKAFAIFGGCNALGATLDAVA